MDLVYKFKDELYLTQFTSFQMQQVILGNLYNIDKLILLSKHSGCSKNFTDFMMYFNEITKNICINSFKYNYNQHIIDLLKDKKIDIAYLNNLFDTLLHTIYFKPRELFELFIPYNDKSINKKMINIFTNPSDIDFSINYNWAASSIQQYILKVLENKYDCEVTKVEQLKKDKNPYIYINFHKNDENEMIIDISTQQKSNTILYNEHDFLKINFDI